MRKAMQSHGLTTGPVSCRNLVLQFHPVPSHSLKELLIKMGPFEPQTDAFRFDNNEFLLTAEQVEQIRQPYRFVIDSVLNASPLKFVREALHRLSVDIPVIGRVGLPDFIIESVIGTVRSELAGLLSDLILNMTGPPRFGRCGGMVFSAYDFYLLDWTVDARLGGTTSPSTGVLGDYIFSRLLDSLELNVGTFLEWFTNLHILPHAKVSSVAQAALIAAVAIWGGPIGAAFAELIAVVNVFGDLGGRKVLLKSSKDQWPLIKATLDRQAACALGLLFGDSDVPWNDHQLMALSYVDNGNDTATVTVWDNRDTPNPLAFSRDVFLDFRGDELTVDVPSPPADTPWDIKGIFLEEYHPQIPPASLRLPV
jgi:hypothetical protein